MNKKQKQSFELLKKEEEIFLQYLKAKFPLFHNSNFFFRDLQYGIKGYLEKKNIFLSQAEAETLATEYGNFLSDKGIFQSINHVVWRVNYPEFVTQVPGDPL